MENLTDSLLINLVIHISHQGLVHLDKSVHGHSYKYNLNLIGGVTVMHPLVLADLVQRERLTDAMGWEIMSAGMGYCLSTPLATLVSLQVGDVHISYIVSGVLMVVGGLLVVAAQSSHHTISEADINRLRQRLESGVR